jgi:hypothetical protein
MLKLGFGAAAEAKAGATTPISGADSGAPATLSDDTPAASSDCSQSVQVPCVALIFDTCM